MELRLIPVMAFAAASLLAVKVVSIVQFDGRLPFAAASRPEEHPPFSEQELAAIDESDLDITGSTPAAKDNDKDKDKSKEAEKPAGPIRGVSTTRPQEAPQLSGAKFVAGGGSPAERALYEKLGERRQELDKKQRDLELRENLLKDAEARLQTRLDELRDLENRLNGKGGEQRAKLRNIVTMYEGMSPKEAARIFDKLDQTVLVDVASVMNPKKLAAVLAAMSPDAAQRLTVELAKRTENNEQGLPATDLKKVETKPAG
jgi:flagellar motility protein MotE (MotC chaperone)